MIYYVDTSALFKRFILEEGAEELTQLSSNADYLLTSFLTELEILASLERAKNMRRINSPALRQAIKGFEKEIDSGEIGLVPMSEAIHKVAKRLVRQRRLRAPDAIQLATALSLPAAIKEHLLFLAADVALVDAARLEGMTCHLLSI